MNANRERHVCCVEFVITIDFFEVAHFLRNATSLSATTNPLTLEALHQKPTF